MEIAFCSVLSLPIGGSSAMSDNILLFGIGDLARRWNYQTHQAVHKKIRLDKKFPKPIGLINKNTKVFNALDIVAYEKLRPALLERQNNPEIVVYNQSKKEWYAMSEEERDKHF